MTKKTALFFLFALSFGFQAIAQIPIPRAKLTTPDVAKYKETGFFSTGGLGPVEEYSSGAYQKSIVLDEAKIVKVEGNEVFFELILRAHTSEDQAVTQLTTKINGSRIYPVDEEVGYIDYEYQSDKVVASFEKITDNTLTQIKITEKENKIFRVITRKVTFSHTFAKGVPDKIKLHLSHGLGYGYDHREITFFWKIVN